MNVGLELCGTLIVGGQVNIRPVVGVVQVNRVHGAGS